MTEMRWVQLASVAARLVGQSTCQGVPNEFDAKRVNGASDSAKKVLGTTSIRTATQIRNGHDISYLYGKKARNSAQGIDAGARDLRDEQDFGVFLGDHEEFEGGGRRKNGIATESRDTQR
jgi:hypothetical protein